MIPLTKEPGPIYYRKKFHGINGGTIEATIYKNRICFNKNFWFNDNESFETAIKILNDGKVSAICHLKNESTPNLGRLAEYVLESTLVEEMPNLT